MVPLVRDGGYRHDAALSTLLDGDFIGHRLYSKLKQPMPPSWWSVATPASSINHQKYIVWYGRPTRVSHWGEWAPALSAPRVGFIDQSRVPLLPNEQPLAEVLSENGFDLATRPRSKVRDADLDVHDSMSHMV